MLAVGVARGRAGRPQPAVGAHRELLRLARLCVTNPIRHEPGGSTSPGRQHIIPPGPNKHEALPCVLRTGLLWPDMVLCNVAGGFLRGCVSQLAPAAAPHRHTG